MPGKILVTARSFRKTEGPHKQILRDAGYELVESPNEQPLQAAELALLIADVDAAILGLDAVTSAVLDAAPHLRVISRYGVGVDKVDVPAATRHKVAVTVTPGANSVAVAELAVGLMLALARSIPYHDRVARAGKWSRLQGIELTGSTLGLIGLGRIGQEVARRARGLGMHVLYYDPVPPPADRIADLHVDQRELAELIAQSDVISLHLPLTADTRNIIDAQALSCMKPGALLINTARGGLVDETALYEALSKGSLGGAAFDVFETEPPDASPLLSLDNFIAIPHAGSATSQTTLKMGLMASENALAVLRGEQPVGLLNPEIFASQG